jgi:hypothetical protein
LQLAWAAGSRPSVHPPPDETWLNVALFGHTAKEWSERNREAKGNVRDQATLEQLVVLSNLESLNAVLIRQGMPQSERLIRLNQIAIIGQLRENYYFPPRRP